MQENVFLGWGFLKEGKERMFFFGPDHVRCSLRGRKSLLLLFFRKEDLPYFLFLHFSLQYRT